MSLNVKFHCSYLDGKIITIETCEKCKMSSTCDIYATLLDEDDEYDVLESKIENY